MKFLFLISGKTFGNEKNTEEMQQQLIPDVEIFKEIMVELIRNKEMDLEALKKERSDLRGSDEQIFSSTKCCSSFQKKDF